MSQSPSAGKPSALVDTRVVYCGDNLDQSFAGQRAKGHKGPKGPKGRQQWSRRARRWFRPLSPLCPFGPFGLSRQGGPRRPSTIAFGYSQDALDEVGRFFKQTGKVIVALTVKEILDEQIAMKLV